MGEEGVPLRGLHAAGRGGRTAERGDGVVQGREGSRALHGGLGDIRARKLAARQAVDACAAGKRAAHLAEAEERIALHRQCAGLRDVCAIGAEEISIVASRGGIDAPFVGCARGERAVAAAAYYFIAAGAVALTYEVPRLCVALVERLPFRRAFAVHLQAFACGGADHVIEISAVALFAHGSEGAGFVEVLCIYDIPIRAHAVRAVVRPCLPGDDAR